ncbi:MAG: glycosyltransferase family 2 protein [Clostridia bacterium]|nr:glycosyltransferase family 2 protein [Clostridia bacterium]
MNEQADISIIVPCYNAEKHLPDCLASLKAQRGPCIEMIFIDDGSVDATGRILDDFAAGDPRASVVHIPNGGVSAARNRGLDMATGRYIAFLDADDTLEKDALEMLYALAVSSGAQIVSADHLVYDLDHHLTLRVTEDGLISLIECEPYRLVQQIIHMDRIFNNIWNKLYARPLFDGLRLDEEVRIGEDALLNIQLYLRAEKIAHLPEFTYVYRIHSASAMAGVKNHSEAHQPMLRSMSRILLEAGVKERYFKDFLQTCIWIDEKQRGIRACMRTFDQRVRPLAMEGVQREKLGEENQRLFDLISRGMFPAFYVLMRIREKLTGRKWGIRR